jgi:hypothetical protein
MPPSGVVPAQSMPSASLQFALPAGTGPQVPSAFVPEMLHTPEQQLAPVPHESPVCWQNEGDWQVPFAAQNPEQHVPASGQGLPMLAQLGLSGVQVPPEPQLWLQHWPLEVHAALSGVQAGYVHTPALQSLLQQSPLEVHARPNERHVLPSVPKTSGLRPPSPGLLSPPEPLPSAFCESATVPSLPPPSSPFPVLLFPPHAAKPTPAAQTPHAATIPTHKAFIKRMSPSLGARQHARPRAQRRDQRCTPFET